MASRSSAATSEPDGPMNAAEAVLGPPLRAGHGDRPAILWRDSSINYDQVAASVNRAGNALRGMGVEPENRVLMLLKDTPELVYVYLGAMKIGAVAVALNLRASNADLLYMLRDSRAKVLVVDRELMPAYEAVAGQLDGRPRIVVADADDEAACDLRTLLADQPTELEPVLMSPDDMAFWIYTSGTTGAPKAAVHVHQDVLVADAYPRETLGLVPGDVVYATSKLFFAYALGTCLFAAFRTGATTVLSDAWPDPAQVRAVLDRHRPDLVFSVPALYRNLLKAGVAEEPAFGQVRHFISAGERLPATLWRRWKDATGVEILDGMGTSETIYMLLTNWPGRVVPGASGTAAPGAEVRLANAEGDQAPPGEPGILWGRIASRCDRYWNRRTASQAVFKGEWFCTGDMYVVEADGYWRHQGRHDDMLKISGQWVSPAEIEETVLAHTGVRDAAVVGIEDADGLMRTMLFAAGPADGFEPAALEADIRRAVADRLSPYKRPKWIRFVDEIPRTATGKTQRFKLRVQARVGEG